MYLVDHISLLMVNQKIQCGNLITNFVFNFIIFRLTKGSISLQSIHKDLKILKVFVKTASFWAYSTKIPHAFNSNERRKRADDDNCVTLLWTYLLYLASRNVYFSSLTENFEFYCENKDNIKLYFCIITLI